ncbi:diguanylate cyclase DgcA [Treponema sp.]|uniref:diguanylate cyclase DgcA n=1 Tax=Treponema sp. TaxID=166 RepID=UPI00298E39D8|nr:diguanylate cyclase DgcA [Treponema sp.]MCQ2242308.1 sensor domain-containing diguanylate cyclase [Treponema sp.]
MATKAKKKGTVRKSAASSSTEKKENEVIAEFEKHIYDLQQMLEISRSFCTTIELNPLVESILYIAMAQMRVTGAGIFVINELNDENGYVLSDHYSGIAIDPTIEYKIPVNSKLVEFFTQSNNVFTLPELKEYVPDAAKEFSMLESLSPSLVVPLILKNRLNGILVMGERIFIDGMESAYTNYERDEIQTIASLASVAVHNASLIEQASTDMMTHLKLKFFFFNILEDKLDNAFAQNEKLSILMFDIDFFKKFNDTYGHACGDYVLQHVAKIIKDSIRDEDMACRYGGEEFTVMLCNTDVEGAYRVAERIRTRIEETELVYENNRMNLTISGGISVFSVDDNPVRSARILVDQADKALYVSKANGRNRVSVADGEEIK